MATNHMSVGRLAWRTATGALLWEIWGRRKWNFLWHGITLLGGIACVVCKALSASEVMGAILALIAVTCFLGSYLCLLTWFGYIEADPRQLRVGFPGRLLLKPVSTLRLALVPMTFGGAAVVTVLLLWDKLVLDPLGYAGPVTPLWLGAVCLSFFWWSQALAWSLPRMGGRGFALLIISVLHLLIGLAPLSPVPVAAGWHWLILAGLLGTAVLVAFIGLKWTRRGAWEGPSWFSLARMALRPGRTRLKVRAFASPFFAQFWLEWRVNGLVLPGVVAGIGAAIIPVICLVGEPGETGDLGIVIVNLMVTVPLVLSGVMSTAVARLDPLQPSGTLPTYLAVRPITNGGLLLAKLAVGLVSSVLTWLVAVAAICFWLAVLGRGSEFTNARAFASYGIGALVIGSLPVLLLLIVLTWKNLLGGVAAVFTGRKWVIGLFSIWRTVLCIGLIALILAAKDKANFRTTLLYWLPWCLTACVLSKIGVGVAAFARGLHRKAITAGAVGWIAGGWAAGGVFIAAYSGLVCSVMNKPDIWFPIALAGFLVLPLADLAIAPLSLAWNRHR